MIVRMALVDDNIVENIVVVDDAEAPVIFPGFQAYVEVTDDTPCNPGWVWDGGKGFKDDGADLPRPLVRIEDPPVNGRVLFVRYWQTYDAMKPYSPGANPGGLAKQEKFAWSGDRLLSKTTVTFDGKGVVVSTETETYSTGPSGVQITEGE